MWLRREGLTQPETSRCTSDSLFDLGNQRNPSSVPPSPWWNSLIEGICILVFVALYAFVFFAVLFAVFLDILLSKLLALIGLLFMTLARVLVISQLE